MHIPYYSKIQYSCVDISNHLLEKCKSTISKDHSVLVQKNQVSFSVQDVSEYQKTHQEEVLFVLFEILDNFPHDKIVIDTHKNLIFEAYKPNQKNYFI